MYRCKFIVSATCEIVWRTFYAQDVNHMTSKARKIARSKSWRLLLVEQLYY